MSVFKDIIIEQSRDLDEIESVANDIELLVKDLKIKSENYRKRWFFSDQKRTYEFSQEKVLL